VPGRPSKKPKKTDHTRLHFATASRGWAAAREKKDPTHDHLGCTPHPPRVVKALCEHRGIGYDRVYPSGRDGGLVTLDERISVPVEAIGVYDKFLDELRSKAASEIVVGAGTDTTNSDAPLVLGVSHRYLTPEEEIDQGFSDWLDTA
jgi:hypothetical protein